jgi:hypothetical protein
VGGVGGDSGDGGDGGDEAMDASTVSERWRRDGFVIVPGLLAE